MKVLLAIFFIFLFSLLLYLTSITGFFTKVERLNDGSMRRGEWRLIARVEVLNGKVVNITKIS